MEKEIWFIHYVIVAKKDFPPFLIKGKTYKATKVTATCPNNDGKHIGWYSVVQKGKPIFTFPPEWAKLIGKEPVYKR